MVKRIGAVVLVLTCAGLLNGCAYITRASETQQGVSPPGESQNPDLSFDGRYVAFDTDAALDPAEPDDSVTDVYVRDNQTANVVRISTADGDAGNGPSRNPSISDNGRFVAFESDASNLVPLDTNNVTDVLWHDRDADADGIYDEPGAVVTLAASAVGLTLGNGASTNPSVTGDGTVVVFASLASNLTQMPLPDANTFSDIYSSRFDPGSGQHLGNRLVSINDNFGTPPVPADGPSWEPDVRHDGRGTTFRTAATNLHFLPDENNREDVVVVTDDNILGIRMVFRAVLGPEPNADQFSPRFVGDKTSVVFASAATNLAPGDTGGQVDVFVADWTSTVTSAVSRTPAGAEANGSSFEPNASADGTRIAFHSTASDLVPGDTNATSDVFVRVAPGFTQRASTTALLGPADLGSGAPVMSGDGVYVAFLSSAHNLEAPDTNPDADVFVRAAVVPEINSVVAIDVNTHAEIPPVLHAGTSELLVKGRGFGPVVTGFLGTGVTVTVLAVQPNQVRLRAFVAVGTATGPRTLGVANLGTGLGTNAGALQTCPNCVQIAP